ncbi:MAG: radical SAM protein [Candidatus Omnitrophica bacterium]|nr:radical SAM protein [Candidatus Omnitrophota bacterium]
MKILIAYPPLKTEKGCPTLGQNRQFQYFKEPTYIYPVVPAQAATLLKEKGFEVVWKDAIAEGMSLEGFLDFVKETKPDLIAMETKTPVVKQHWKIIDKIKGLSPTTEGRKETVPYIVLFGDHVTALPEESFKNSKVDFVLTGGDYDFLLMNLCNAIKKSRDTGSGVRGSDLEAGIWYRQEGTIKNTGKFQLGHDLNSLPFIDRELTRWKDYAIENGNYKRLPGTYIMSGRDCWWGKCTFCSWPTLYPHFRSRTPENVLEEIDSLITRYQVREIMDDTGCFPVGSWLREFCRGMIQHGFSSKIYLDCNMRFGALSSEDLVLMKKANFRLLLFGLESANQNTLDRINKNLNVDRIIEDCKAARCAGLFPHITIMFGYPWESYEDAQKTLQLGRWLLKKGYAYTMQATMVIPYPGSPLFEECKTNGWLTSTDWDTYDMKQPVMRIPFAEEELMKLVQGMYGVSFEPEFLLRKLFSIRDMDDARYYMRAAKKVAGHLFDFKKSR